MSSNQHFIACISTSSLLADAPEELDIEIQRRIWGDHAPGTALPVCQVGRQDKLPDPMSFHGGQLVAIPENPQIPTADDLVRADHESERLPTIVRAVKHAAGHLRVESSRVMCLDERLRDGTVAVADLHVAPLQALGLSLGDRVEGGTAICEGRVGGHDHHRQAPAQRRHGPSRRVNWCARGRRGMLLNRRRHHLGQPWTHRPGRLRSPELLSSL
mmetsp:Transcript_1489/g.4833  ORF Transcript_1489/g.4833 Transcript_1489/m.4833 type:complete len:215 (-) Transcript_1489:4042-4686(-)